MQSLSEILVKYERSQAGRSISFQHRAVCMILDIHGANPSGEDPVVVNVETIFTAFGSTALLTHLPEYERVALREAGEGRDVVLTGRGPIWLYLRLAHALHGAVRKLSYRAPEAGEVLIFDHTSR